MAGIGFELRKLMQQQTFFGLLKAYGYASLISSGPWVLSIVGIQLVGLICAGGIEPGSFIGQFQVSVTYLMVASLTLTGVLQLAFTRYIADRIFERRQLTVLPSLLGALQLTILVSAAIGIALLLTFFEQTALLYRLLMLIAFVVLCSIWMAAIFLSSLKAYKSILMNFAVGYGITIGACFYLRRLGLEGLLLGFVLGHAVLLSGMLRHTAREYPADHFICFDFLARGRMYRSLMAIGFLYYLGLWADKLLFWFNPNTSIQVVGPLRASPIYDLPVFLAYLSILPGMAVFLMRVETDFAEYYRAYYDAVREGGTLRYIREMRDEMVFSIRQGIMDIIKIQSIAVVFTIVAGPSLLEMLAIPSVYLPLLHIQVVGASLQVVFLAVINIFMYLDKRAVVLILTLGFCCANIGLTLLSHYLGAYFYGYGFTLAMLLTVVAGLLWLDRKLDVLEYETFMLQ